VNDLRLPNVKVFGVDVEVQVEFYDQVKRGPRKMKQQIPVCAAGVVIGAILTIAWVSQPLQWPHESTIQAQTSPSISENNDENLPLLASTQHFTPEELVNIRVYEVANASVVNITTSMAQYDHFFMLRTPGEGSGSGSVLDKEGHVLTNYHVVEDAEEIDVTLANDNNFAAQLIGFDKETDIAVLKINAPTEQLYPINLGTSDKLRVGQRVYALGNPFGLDGTLTTGIISSLNRTPSENARRRSLKALIQTDAAMNPGNSGGPLLNTNAEVIGMNIAIATKTGQNAGVGFAIPANRIRRIVPELIKHGRIIRPDHGIVSLMPTNQGLKITKVNRGGPADRAGLRGFRIVRQQKQRGAIVYQREFVDSDYADYILAVNGQSTRTPNEFLDVVEQFQPGDEIIITILREGHEEQVTLSLGSI
jgi:S1-C subfamily serine protease